MDANGADITDVNHIGVLNPFRYRSYFYDEETGLYYLKTRYYDPETGRFITIDDIAILDTTRDYTNGLNLYAYCFNDPVNTSDDEGDMPNWLKWLLGILTFIGAVALTVLSGGSLTPVFVGMGISIIGGGLLQGTITAVNGGSFWQGFADGAADGALWGGIFALAGASISFIKNINLIRSNGVVIGKGMERVGYVADQLALAKYTPMKGYKFISKVFGTKIADKLSIAHNRAWIRRVMRLNKRVLDIGLGGAVSAGAWYGMELQEVADYIWYMLF
ncbi:MAG TPA: RHS repeat-associated core domain-containing protein [Firmicutes bacterium]|nr:RHS repeat-associated core domain-containing protein [Bacillota bacterium]